MHHTAYPLLGSSNISHHANYATKHTCVHSLARPARRLELKTCTTTETRWYMLYFTIQSSMLCELQHCRSMFGNLSLCSTRPSHSKVCPKRVAQQNKMCQCRQCGSVNLMCSIFFANSASGSAVYTDKHILVTWRLENLCTTASLARLLTISHQQLC